MNNIKVSILTTTFNSEEYLEETILSVINQKYKNYEYIIIDAGSTDQTLDIVKKYDKYITYWVSEPDKGIYDGINKGIKKATGDLIKIVNSDDLLTDNSIRRAVELYEKHSSKDKHFILMSSLERIDAKGNVISIWKNKENIFFFENLLHPTWYVPKKVYQELGLYDLSYRIASDYDYYMKLLQNNVRIIRDDMPFAQYREGGSSANFTGRKEVITIKKKYRGAIMALALQVQIQLIKFYSNIKKIIT